MIYLKIDSNFLFHAQTIEVEKLILAFSSDEQFAGFVNYKDFCRFIDPDPQASKAMSVLREFSSRAVSTEKKMNLTQRDVFSSVLPKKGALDEEDFITKMMKLSGSAGLNLNSSELSRLFKHIDLLDKNEKITLDQLLTVLNVDEINGVPFALQEKLSRRVIDLASTNKKPIQFFNQTDHWGSSGKISRLDFQRVLKQMGFQLVDDYVHDAPFSHELPLGSERDDVSRLNKGLHVHGVHLQDDHDPLNDTMGSGDEILEPTDGGAGPVDEYDREDGLKLHPRIVQKQLQEQFNAKTAELQAKSEMAHRLARERAQADGGGPVGARGDLLPTRTDFIDANHSDGLHIQSQNRAGIDRRDSENRTLDVHGDLSDPYTEARGRGAAAGTNGSRSRSRSRSRSPRASTVLTMASKRGDIKIEIDNAAGFPIGARIVIEPGTSEMEEREVIDFGSLVLDSPLEHSHPIGTIVECLSKPQAGSRRALSHPRDKSPLAQAFAADAILAAEDAIRESLEPVPGKTPVDLPLGFASVDSKNRGIVDKKQFAFVISKFKSISLAHDHLVTLMNYFDRSSNGTEIDYNAFIRFCRYRQVDPLPTVARLHKLIFSSENVLKIRAYDTVGNGSIRRQDMLRALSDLGYGHLSQSHLLEMIALFETKTEGLVNYINFCDFVRENDTSVAYDELCTIIRKLLGGADFQQHITRWFKRLSHGQEHFGTQQLKDFLDEEGVDAPKEVVAAAIANMDPEHDGVRFGRFKAWLESGAQSKIHIHGDLTIAELQKKAHAFLVAVAARGDSSIDQIAQSYLVYDWRKSGVIGKPEFLRGTRRAGFVFTHAELRSLSSEFSNGSGAVSYRKFLQWATPSQDAASAISGHIATSGDKPSHGARHASSTIVHFLEKCIDKGIDLFSVFGRFDSNKVGRITADEFCGALSDIGLSSMTQKEVLDAADRFKACSGSYVMYRTMVTEVIQQSDDSKGAADVDIIDAVKVAMQKSRVKLRRLRDAFELFDKSHAGRVREEDLGPIFEEVNISLKRLELQTLADRYASSGSTSGWVQYTSLLAALQARMGESGFGLTRSAGISEELAVKIRSHIELLILRGKDFRSEFDKFTKNSEGTVLQSDFRDIVQERFRSGFSNQDLEILEKTYRDINDPRKVNYVKLLNDFHPRYYGETHDSVDIRDIAEVLRAKIRRRCDYLTPGELKRPFKHFIRTAGASKASREDFALGVKDLGVRAAADQERALFDFINLDGGNAIKYTDFVVFVVDPLHLDILWKLRRCLQRTKVSEHEVIEKLSEQDKNSSGLITANQFTKVMLAHNIDLSESDVLRLMLRFDYEEAQRFDLEAFIRFLRGQDPLDGMDVDGATAYLSRRASEGSKKLPEAADSAAWNSLKRRVVEKIEIGKVHSVLSAPAL